MTASFFPTRDPKKSISQSETEILKFWQDQNVFQDSIDSRHPKRPFVFFDGPPFATGTPHYGHILAGTIKDAIPRYWTMKGYRVDRKFGWDCHGLPVEYQVEKEKNIGGKPGIEALGVGKFNELCRSIVLRCRDEWEDTVSRMGRFVDFKNDYKTMDPEFMESVWWVFGQLWEKGLIYEGHKVVAYSPKLGSPLSNFEANLNYKDIDDPAVTVKFQLTKKSSDHLIKLVSDRLYSTEVIKEGDSLARLKNKSIKILAWTTTPWTLPSNCALGFGRDKHYRISEYKGENYVVSHEYNFEEIGEEKILVNFLKGSELKGLKYEPLFNFFDNGEDPKRFTIIHDDGDYVTTDSGTGIVHMAPFFGAEDDELCKKFGIEGVNPIGDDGYFDFSSRDLDPGMEELQGLYFRADPEVAGSKENNANDWVIKTLKESGQLFRRDQIRHSYPHCWRTDCALMYRGITTWFVSVSTIKNQMIEQNQNINWNPAHLKDGRFGKILEGAPDWAISRNRYWGTPIPIWRCDKTGEIEVISSQAVLEAKVGHPVEDLHKHFVDELTWENPKTGGTMRRIEEVLDCWFESGSMPYGSIHYPFSDQEFQPANFIAEGLDQTRGWFYTLHVLGVALWGKNVFENVICNGIVLAEDGQKMSKSKKNYPDPNLVFDKYGADAIRFYLLKSPVTKGENLRFAESEVEEVLKSLILPLRNAYQFFSLYANIDGWRPTKFTFVRHGEAAHNVNNVYCGNAENCHGLTRLGVSQAQTEATKLHQVDQIYTSPMPRAQQTAEILGEKLQLKPLKSDTRLTEVHFGELEGKPWEPVLERLENPTTESLEILQTRVDDFMKEAATTHAGEHLAVVSHGAVIKAVQTGHLFGDLSKRLHLDFPTLKTGGSQVLFPLPRTENELDRWIISELQSTILEYRTAFDAYDLERACRTLPNFVDQLNNWYLRRNRARFWASGLSEDKAAGYQTLHYVLLNLSKLLAPICPFFAEELYQGIIGEPDRSVHLEFMPLANEALIDQTLEHQTKLTREVVGLAASIRAAQKLKLRQPLAKLQFALSQSVPLDLDLIAAEANVKTVEVLQDLEGIAQKIIKVDARQVGKKFGKKVQDLIQAGKEGRFVIKDSGQVEIEEEILEVGEYEIGFLTEAGLEAEATQQVVVLLDTTLTPELETEGLAREIIRAVQELRKASNFDVSDRIRLEYATDSEALQTALKNHQAMIQGETLCDKIRAGKGTQTLELDGHSISLSLTRA